MECGDDACDGPGPPPQFHIPPPPRPPFIQELVSGIECTEDSVPEMDICAAIPVSITIRSTTTRPRALHSELFPWLCRLLPF